MVAKLVIEEGDLKGLSLSFDEGDTWAIGRDPEQCQLVIEDPLVSRKHLIARRTPEGIVLENLSETNPVFLNDEELSGLHSHLLQHGDTLKIGNEILRFYEESSAQVLDENLEDLTEEDHLAEEEHLSEFDDIDNAPEDADNIVITPEEHSLPASAPESMEEPSSSPEPESEAVTETPLSSTDDEFPTQDTILGEEEENHDVSLAEIDFGIIETGRWLLKVIGGPNSGAEFYMQAGNSYVIGTDPKTCDIVFHDTSVSRQHARITVTPEDAVIIDDLKSRNGILVNGSLIEERLELSPNTIVTVGTTAFVIYDREGEMHTIISPLLPSIVKVLQQETAPAPIDPSTTETHAEESQPAEPLPTEPLPPPQQPRQFGPYIVLSAIIGLFVLAGIGTSTLFHDEPVVQEIQANASELIQQALSSFPSIRWTFNKSNGSLLLLGHVATSAEKNRIAYKLSDLKFIKSVDDNGIIIDEGVLSEVNSLLLNNPEWKGIRVYSVEAGQFILSGTLKTRKQAEQLSSYLSLNFPYLDLLKKQIIVEEDIIYQVQAWLQSAQLSDVAVAMSNGEITLTGSYAPDKVNDLNDILAKVKQIPGVRIIANQSRSQTAETGTIDISDHYQITGKSRLGNKYTVIINGRILSEGDDLDGMNITKITANYVLLQKDRDKFRINYY